MAVGSKWIFPRSMAGTDGAKLDELTAAGTLPSFTEGEMAELRALLLSRSFTSKKQRKRAWSGEMFVHQFFDVTAELTSTRLMIESSANVDDLLTGAEVSGDIAAKRAFALFEVWEGKWTPSGKPKKKKKKTKTK